MTAILSLFIGGLFKVFADGCSSDAGTKAARGQIHGGKRVSIFARPTTEVCASGDESGAQASVMIVLYFSGHAELI